jgi:glycosyltransferase involved in cell wall biosynthesis
MDGMEWMRSKYNKPTQTFLRWAESLAARKAHTMIADSPGIQKYLYGKYGRKPVYIPYGASPFTNPNVSVLSRYGLERENFFLLIARMEPENNIEMIIRGHLDSGENTTLFIIGNITNKFGKYITGKYNDPLLKYSDGIYDQEELNNLRYFCSLYFHGHSVGGTNPSLLEAMACGCNIAAHNNDYNRAVLHDEAIYFSSDEDIANIIRQSARAPMPEKWKRANLEKIMTTYNEERIIDDYEELMMDCCGRQKTEDRRRKTEDRSEKKEDRRRKTEAKSGKPKKEKKIIIRA